MIQADALQEYLTRLLESPVEILRVRPLGEVEATEGAKGFGYGIPLEITYRRDGRAERVVLETMGANAFGHEHYSDRAQALLLAYDTYGRLPRHVRSLDVGILTPGGRLRSVRDGREFFLLMEYVEGTPYYQDLERLVQGGDLEDLDRARARALARYLVEIHQVRREEPSLYRRRIRDLMGHGECIMGIVDSYPLPYGFITPDLLQRIETQCVAWRWRIRDRTHRLCQVHGDFHPWNILFREGTEFILLDRSRGEWGEAADDLAALSINYLFASLRRYGRLEGPFAVLFRDFWETYLEGTGDEEILEVIPPFLAWRALTVASPVWYPYLPLGVRRALFSLVESVLASPALDLDQVGRALEGP